LLKRLKLLIGNIVKRLKSVFNIHAFTFASLAIQLGYNLYMIAHWLWICGFQFSNQTLWDYIINWNKSFTSIYFTWIYL